MLPRNTVDTRMALCQIGVYQYILIKKGVEMGVISLVIVILVVVAFLGSSGKLGATL